MNGAQLEMDTLIIGAEDIDRLMEWVGPDEVMDRTIAALEVALCDGEASRETALPPRAGFRYQEPEPALFEWMPVLQDRSRVTIKLISYIPRNPDDRGLPTVLGTVQGYDFRTGRLLALTDAVFLTAVRTGAASALATRAFAHPDGRTLGLIGCGAQAVTQLHAIGRVHPVEEVLVHDIDPRTAETMAERATFCSKPIRVVPRDLVEREADILCVATSVGIGDGPVIAGDALKPHVHVNAVGSDLPGKTELPLDLLQRCLVCPDFADQALEEGECQQLAPEDLGPDLRELVARPEAYAAYRERRTVFDSTGTALEDHVALEVLVDLARELELGHYVRVQHLPVDARDPYSISPPETGRVHGPGLPEQAAESSLG